MSKIWRVFVGSATFAAVVLFSTSAQAGIIRGAWDSDWGTSYPNTRFDGFVEFFVPNACLPAGSAFIGNIPDTFSCSGGGMYLIKASATLYNNNGTEELGDDTPLSTIVFTPPVQSPDPVLGVFVDWDGSNLLAAELRTDLIGPQSSGVASSFAPANLFLKFSWGAGPGGETLPAGAYLIGCSYEGETCVPSDSQRSNPATVAYTTVPAGSPFDCSEAEPINSLSVIWYGLSPILVKAWNGAVGEGTPTYFGTTDNPVEVGDKVTFTRFGTYPNDIYWELFNVDGTLYHAESSYMGQSTFHLSCSDEDMNGPEDCGKLAGDGKGNIGYINEWLFEGMAGNGLVLGCTPFVIDDLIQSVSTLPDGTFKNPISASGLKNAMASILNEAEQLISAGDLAGAVQKLENLRLRLDGCGNKADKNDWIADCAAQIQMRTLLDQIIAELGGP